MIQFHPVYLTCSNLFEFTCLLVSLHMSDFSRKTRCRATINLRVMFYLDTEATQVRGIDIKLFVGPFHNLKNCKKDAKIKNKCKMT